MFMLRFSANSFYEKPSIKYTKIYPQKYFKFNALSVFSTLNIFGKHEVVVSNKTINRYNFETLKII